MHCTKYSSGFLNVFLDLNFRCCQDLSVTESISLESLSGLIVRLWCFLLPATLHYRERDESADLQEAGDKWRKGAGESY